MCSNSQFMATSAPLCPVAIRARLQRFSGKPMPLNWAIASASYVGSAAASTVVISQSQSRYQVKDSATILPDSSD